MSYLNGLPVFFKGQMGALKDLTRDRSLKLKHWRILIYLFGSLDWNGQAAVRQTTIARDLGIYRSDVSRTIRDLEARGLVWRSRRWDGQRVFEISPTFARCGRTAGQLSVLPAEN